MRSSLQTALQSIARTNVATTDRPYERLHEHLRVALYGVAPQGDPLPPSRMSKLEVVLLPAPSQALIGQSGAPRLQAWSELWCRPQQYFIINILTTTKIILIKHQIVVYAYPNSRK